MMNLVVKNTRLGALGHVQFFGLKGLLEVWLYRDVVATPFVPWCLEQRGCCAGVMITASHNPAADNGRWGFLCPDRTTCGVAGSGVLQHSSSLT